MATILTKRSNTASSVPVAGDLTNSTGGAELAVNTADKRLFTKDSGGTVVELGTNPSSITLASGTANAVPYLNGSKVLTSGSALQFDGTNLGLGVTPSAWYSGSKAIQIGASTSLSDLGGSYTLLGQNYKTGTSGNDIYINNGYASLYSQNGGAHRWYTAPSGTAGDAISFTQAMTLDASGRLGIGSTSPSGKLDVVGVNGTFRVENNGDAIAFTSNAGNFISAKGGTSAYLVFETGGAIERARIDSSGNLLVGTTSGSSARVRIKQASDVGSALDVDVASSAYYLTRYSVNSSVVGSVTTSGTTVSFNTSSDYRLKNTIAPMTGALAKVALLKPCTYKWNADGSDGEGFIAHELAEVCPQAVSGEKDAVDAEGKPVYQGIDTSFLVATLTAAIQEQQAIIEQLKARLDAANL